MDLKNQVEAAVRCSWHFDPRIHSTAVARSTTKLNYGINADEYALLTRPRETKIKAERKKGIMQDHQNKYYLQWEKFGPAPCRPQDVDIEYSPGSTPSDAMDNNGLDEGYEEEEVLLLPTYQDGTEASQMFEYATHLQDRTHTIKDSGICIEDSFATEAGKDSPPFTAIPFAFESGGDSPAENQLESSFFPDYENPSTYEPNGDMKEDAPFDLSGFESSEEYLPLSPVLPENISFPEQNTGAGTQEHAPFFHFNAAEICSTQLYEGELFIDSPRIAPGFVTGVEDQYLLEPEDPAVVRTTLGNFIDLDHENPDIACSSTIGLRRANLANSNPAPRNNPKASPTPLFRPSQLAQGNDVNRGRRRSVRDVWESGLARGVGIEAKEGVQIASEVAECKAVDEAYFGRTPSVGCAPSDEEDGDVDMGDENDEDTEFEGKDDGNDEEMSISISEDEADADADDVAENITSPTPSESSNPDAASLSSHKAPSISSPSQPDLPYDAPSPFCPNSPPCVPESTIAKHPLTDDDCSSHSEPARKKARRGGGVRRGSGRGRGR
ncbi:hypothetical protein MMC12_006248 [Toensbergia leucococca]|nr:hypothetical protein [Toensbergia leucococca]